MLAFRSASVGFQEISRDSGAFWFPEVRPSCWISVVPAGGLILAPEGYSTCICPYNYKTSLALVPVQRYEDWSVYLKGREDKRGKLKSKTQGTASDIRELRVNFNAPGDRMDADGKLWFAYPRPTRDTKRYADTESCPSRSMASITPFGTTPTCFPSKAPKARGYSRPVLEGPVKIVVQLSDEGSRSYDVQLSFAETDDLGTGDRVFDINVQGKVVASRFDIANESGANHATTHTMKGVNANGTLTIELVPVEGKPPRICSLVITEVGEP